MSILYYGKTIKELRERKRWSHWQLINNLNYYEPVLHRVEKGILLPGDENVSHILDTLGLTLDDFLVPHFEGQSIDIHILCDQLLHALYTKEAEKALSLFNKLLAIKDFNSKPINHQFFLSQKAKLMELQGRPDNEIMLLVQEGLEITLENSNTNDPRNIALLFEEPELFHTLARIHARKGDTSTAIRILTETRNGLIRQPTGKRERDRYIIALLLTLAECQLQACAYQDALDTCDLGIHTSAIRSEGMSTPDFMLFKVKALHGLGQEQQLTSLLRLAYTGYLLLGEKEKADNVMRIAKQEFCVQFNTYGMDELDIPKVKKQPYARGKTPSCDSIGEMIFLLRKEAGLSLKELSQGICSTANLSKIENKRIKAHMHYVEPLLQRLGRDPQLYCNFFLRKDEFEARELRDYIHLLLVTNNHDKAAEELVKLKEYKKYNTGVNLQFILRAEAMLFMKNHGAKNPEFEKQLIEALALTWPDYNEDDLYRKPLTYNESIIIDCLAISYMASEDYKRACKIYEALISNLDRRYVDVREKSRMYAGLIYNYSICLAKLDRRSDALEIIQQAEEFEQRHGVLNVLPLLTYNKAFNLYEKSEKEKSLAYFAMAYYGFTIFKEHGRANAISIARNRVKKNFGIILD